MTARLLEIVALGAGALGAGALTAAFGYSQIVHSGSAARWPDDARIVVTLNSGFAPNNPAELVAGALRFSFRSWNTALAANGIGVQFVDGGITSLNEPQCDQVNLVTFTKMLDPPLPPGVLAATQTFAADRPGLVNWCGASIEAQFGGQILDADLVFNTSEQFSTVGLHNTNDIEQVALHELGHWLGLGHSGVNAAVMAPFGGVRTAYDRGNLHSDDIAGINFVYGTNTPGGAISGTVYDQPFVPVLGAQVVATEEDTGLTRAAALSGPDGRYLIVGLPSGSYRLFVEPLDGPIFLHEVPDVFKGGSASFSTILRASPRGELIWHPVAVAQGETSGVDFSPGTKILNAQQISAGGEGPMGTLPLSIKRGDTVEVHVAGTGLSGNISFSSPAVRPIGPTTRVGQGLSRTVQVATDAPLGAIDVYVASPVDGEFGMSAALTGALQITVNPSVLRNGIVDGAAFSRVPGALDHFSPGSIISIFGTDLAETTALAAALPLPTQLGGVGVRIGNRLAPLYYASPGQINAMIPSESRETVDVEVVAASNSRSRPVSIGLAPSAPRVFSINQQGTGQGAILIANTNVVAAPGESIPGRESRPAFRGEFISIFCMGLGPVSNPPPSGVPASSSLLSHTLSNPAVTIGGVDSTVSFSGLSPGYVGLYQVDVQVPATAPTGDTVPVVMLHSGAPTNPVTLAVE